MPKATLRLSTAEQLKLTKLAHKAGLSLSNYLRQQLGLELISHGGPRPGSGAKPKPKTETA